MLGWGVLCELTRSSGHSRITILGRVTNCAHTASLARHNTCPCALHCDLHTHTHTQLSQSAERQGEGKLTGAAVSGVTMGHSLHSFKGGSAQNCCCYRQSIILPAEATRYDTSFTTNPYLGGKKKKKTIERPQSFAYTVA